MEIKTHYYWQEMTNIVFTTRNNQSAFIQAYKCRQQKAYRKMLWRTRDVIYHTEHQWKEIAWYCSAHFGEIINQERKLQDATRNRKVVKIRDSICQNWQEQRYKYNVTLLVKLHLLIRFFSFCLLYHPKKIRPFRKLLFPAEMFKLYLLVNDISCPHFRRKLLWYIIYHKVIRINVNASRSEFYNMDHRLQNDCKRCQVINLQFLLL